MAHPSFEIHTRDCAGLVLRNLIEMKPKTIGKKGVVPEVWRDESAAAGHTMVFARSLWPFRFSVVQLLNACLALAITIDPEEERLLETYNKDADEEDLEVTVANIGGLTVDCLARFIPAAYVRRGSAGKRFVSIVRALTSLCR